MELRSILNFFRKPREVIDPSKIDNRVHRALVKENIRMRSEIVLYKSQIGSYQEQILNLTSSLEAAQERHLSLSNLFDKVQHSIGKEIPKQAPPKSSNHQGICG